MATRDSKGRFIKGNKAAQGNVGGGRPPRAREERYNEIMLTTCTFEDWEAIIVTAVRQAKRGDWRARRFLADYLLGKAPQFISLLHSMNEETRQFMRELVGLDDEPAS